MSEVSSPNWEEMFKLEQEKHERTRMKNECLCDEIARLDRQLVEMETIKRTLYVVFGRSFDNE